MAVHIVTDSTSDIPLEKARELGITVVPLTIFFGEQAYLDGIELDNARFYQMLQASPVTPRTSQPSPAAFQEAFTSLIDEGADAIIAVNISSKLSGTYQSACTARDTLPDGVKRIPIVVIDSLSVSLGLGMLVMQAAREARQGLGYEEIEAHIRDKINRIRILCVLDTLEYLRRGGRIGGARALVGNMLSVKPILALKHGEIAPVEQPRTRAKAYARMAQLVGEMERPDEIAIIGSDDNVCNQLQQAVQQTLHNSIPTTNYKLGAVIGTYTGPGTAGVVFITPQ
jgi:DegV family protein with EDD domain